MPTLNWIGKNAVVRHHQDVPFRLLEPVAALSCGDADSGNLIVQGDNLHALKALLPRYAAQVKCIYIDPPYNTGNEGWTYNDNVNSSEIRKWLGEVVGKEGETLDRHDRWLCMMYPRLLLLRQFLREDGLIFVSIDDNEQQGLRFLLDEIFGKRNFVAEFVWNTEGHTDNQFPIKVNHEYVVAYARHGDKAVFGYVIDPNTRAESNLWAGFAKNSITKNGSANPPSEVVLPVGFPVESIDLDLPATEIPEGLIRAMIDEKLSSNPLKRRFGKIQFPLRRDAMTARAGALIASCRVFSGWANVEKLKEFIKNGCKPIADDGEGEISFYLSGKGVIYYKKNRGDKARNITSVLRNMGTTEKMRAELERMGLSFKYPKPKELVSYLLRIGSGPGDLVMDTFAGSGTTAHAVLDLNAKGDARRFVLVEMEKNIAEKVTAERVRRVVTGYLSSDGDQVAGSRGGFQYCRLSSEPLFAATGQIRDDVSFQQLSEFVWFSESGAGLAATKRQNVASPLLGVANGTAVFLLYNGILKDRGDLGGNVLNRRTLEVLRDVVGGFTGPWVVYGARTRFDKGRLNQLGITFKQLPYELAVKSWS